MPSGRLASASEKLRRALPFVVGLGLFAVALEVLRHELHAVSWPQLMAAVSATPPSRLSLALGLTFLSYAALTGYDLLAFAYIGKSLPRRQVVLASFLAYAISNNVGFAMLSGASVRYRFYSRWGINAGDLSRIIVSYSITFWAGLLELGGLSLIASAPQLEYRRLAFAAGVTLALLPLGYLILAAVRQLPFRLRSLELPVPSLRLAAGQLFVSALDWALAGAALYVLLPADTLTFLRFLGIFFVAILLGMLSHVPGGLGVFDGVLVLLLKPYVSSAAVLPALIVFRATYYLLPLCIALAGLLLDEAWQRRGHVARATAAVGRLADQLTPDLLATITFLSGVVLLFSGATPAVPARLARLHALLPLGVIEASHFLGSVMGVALLLLSQGLARRLDAAYYLTSTAMLAGMCFSLLKGFDYEEASMLLVAFLFLWRARGAFDRRAAFFETRFSPGWIAALLGTIGASIWLGRFAFQHVEYSNELWWQFEVRGDAPRFLRASVGTVLVLGLFAFARLVRYASHETAVPSDPDLEDVDDVIAIQPYTYPFLAYLRDKALLFNSTRTAFVMYAVQSRTWVALGDPVGPEADYSELIRLFLERCDDFCGVPVFYEVGKKHLHLYADFGLTFVKLGEEARVDLNTLTLEGSENSKLRQSVRRLEKDGCTFRVLCPAQVRCAMKQLRRVSDDWLEAKSSAEKGFSLGFFDETYIARLPVAVIERDGEVQAFANLWAGPTRDELSIDLMRYHRDAPKNVMEALLVHLLMWGKEHSYQWFVLGMAPLSGFEQSPAASLWNRLGAFLYHHGESVYSFQGLRAYKEKFHPTWEPRYLAYPGGLHLPRVMADVSALVAGGYRQIFGK